MEHGFLGFQTLDASIHSRGVSYRTMYMWCCSRFLSLVVPHAQDLDKSDKNVDKVQFQADALVDNILPDHTPFTHAGVVEDFLDVIKSEASKDGKTTVEPDVFSPCQCSHSGCGKNKRGEAGNGDDSYTGKERATKVKVFLLLGSGSNKGNRTHHSNSIETGTGKDGRVGEHEWGEDGGLGNVEGGPEGVFLNIAAIVLD